MATQGGIANRTGRSAESVIASILTERGRRFDRQRLIGRGIFETLLYADFLLDPTPRYPQGLIIESKWQQVSGSAEEKICYLVENIRTCYPSPTIIVIDGDGFRAGALRWVRAQVGHGMLLHVFDLKEFLTWSNRSL